MTRQLVLVGAGTAHLAFLRQLAMASIPNLDITLVTPDLVVPYSAMIPMWLSGERSLASIQIDVGRLCATLKIGVIQGTMTRWDRKAREIRIDGKFSLSYDLLSLDIGSRARPAGKQGISIRPLIPFAARVSTWDKSRPFITVVGGGATGVEITLALAKRYAPRNVRLVHAGGRLLPEFPARAGKMAEQVIRSRGIALSLGERVVDPSGEVVLTTDPVPAEGPEFLAVDAFQRVCDEAFAVGDCAATSYPKNGVFAVRAGKHLYRNLRRMSRGAALTQYRPPRKGLALLDLGDGEGILCRGKMAISSKKALSWKRSIDEKWLTGFRATPMTTEMEPCGGCGSKVPRQILSEALSRVETKRHESVIIGRQEREDAAVIRIPAGRVQVQTVDYFRSFLTDPYRFGRLAAVHALSDLYAMNATPISALALVTLPPGSRQHVLLSAMLDGAASAFEEEGVDLSGGHTTEGAELMLGFSVTGHADEKRLFLKSALKEGDFLILTKPLGTGVLLAAHHRGALKSELFDSLLRGMEQSNARAARLLDEEGIKACTDVTGFGLAGHLLEMLEASGVSAELSRSVIPTYRGAADALRVGVRSTLHPENSRIRDRIQGEAPEILFDPQTCGGLLFGAGDEIVPELLERLRALGYTPAVIGKTFTAKGMPYP